MQSRNVLTMSPDIVGKKNFYIKIDGTITAFIICGILFKGNGSNVIMKIKMACKSIPEGVYAFLAKEKEGNYRNTYVNAVCLSPEDFFKGDYVQFEVPSVVELAKTYKLGSTIIQNENSTFVRRWWWDGDKAIPLDNFEVDLVEITAEDTVVIIKHFLNVDFIRSAEEGKSSKVLQGTYSTEEECKVRSTNEVIDFLNP